MVARSTAGDGAQSLVLPAFEPCDELSVRRWERVTARREAYRKQLHLAQEPPSREEQGLLAAQLRRAEGWTGRPGGGVKILV